MWAIATDGVVWSVSVCVCVSQSVCRFVGHVREPCKNGWIDRNAVWEWLGLVQGTIIRWGPNPPRERAFLEVFRPTEKHGPSLCGAWAVSKRLNRSRHRLEGWFLWVQGTIYWMGINIGRIHSQPRGVTSRRCGLSSKLFDHSSLFWLSSSSSSSTLTGMTRTLLLTQMTMSSPSVCPAISSLPESFARIHRVYAFISCQTSAAARQQQQQ